MLVVLGSRLAISCGLNHQSSSGSLTAFHLFPFEALGWCFVFRGQRNTKVQGAQDAGGVGTGGGVGGKYIFISS